MKKKLSENDIAELGCAKGIEYAAMKAFVSIENEGKRFGTSAIT